MITDPAIIALVVAPFATFALGYWLGGRNKGRALAEWVDAAYRERIAANREARQAEDQEKAAKRRIGEQVRAERLVRLFGETERY